MMFPVWPASWRIIPADAGSTRESICCCASHWDHPRGCGEHAAILFPVYIFWGSSPRMRGAPAVTYARRYSLWIIPADAGSTRFRVLHWFSFADHPRGCGEHALAVLMDGPAMGSSPRMRGAPLQYMGA